MDTKGFTFFICMSFLMSVSSPISLYAAETLTQDSPDAVADMPESFSSVEQRRIFSAVQEERTQLREEKKALVLREKELKTIEESVDKKLAEIDTKLDELQKQKKELAKLLAEKDAEEIKKVQDLSKIYDKMDPVKAALALSGLEQQLAADILANMKTRSAAAVLGSLNRQKATEISRTFSTIQLE